jgi:hypothetical protein
MRDERAKKVGLYGCFGVTNSQFATAVGNDAANGGGGGSNAAEPSSACYEMGSSYNLPRSCDGAEKWRGERVSNIHSLVEGSCIP